MNEFLEQLSSLTCLVHLAIYYRNHDIHHYDTSLTAIESIHSYFPRLQYISIDAVFKSISGKEIETIRNVEPAHTVTKIDLCFPYIDPSWIFYFAHKYPNLVTCNLSSYDDLDYNNSPPSDDKQKYQSQLQLLLSAKQFFPCLQKIDTSVYDINPWPQYLFYDALQCFNVKIKDVTIEFWEKTSKVANPNTCITYFSESVNNLLINYNHSSLAKHKEEKLLAHFNNLTVLKIEYGGYMNMENILDHFPDLQSLYIYYTEICSPKYSQSTLLPHPLQALEYSEIGIDTHVFRYISSRCRQLRYMTLDEIYYHHSDIEETGQVLVDMPFSQLKWLKTYDYGSTFESHPKNIIIEQMGNANSDQGRTPQLNWYHVCVDGMHEMYRLSAWELGRRDIKLAQRYLKCFRRIK